MKKQTFDTGSYEAPCTSVLLFRQEYNFCNTTGAALGEIVEDIIDEIIWEDDDDE